MEEIRMEDEKKVEQPAVNAEEISKQTEEFENEAIENAQQEAKEAELEAPAEEPLLDAPEQKDELADKGEGASAEDARDAAIDEMEKATQKALDAMREKGNPDNEEVVDDAREKLEQIFADFAAWMKVNTQPERIKAEIKTVSDTVNDVLEKTREKVIEVSQNEQFKKTMESGKDFVIGTAGLISDGLKYGYDKLMEVPEFKKVSDAINSKVDDLRHSEKLKSAVEHGEENLHNFSSTLFKGILSFFDTNDAKTEDSAKEEKKPDLPDLPDLPQK